MTRGPLIRPRLAPVLAMLGVLLSLMVVGAMPACAATPQKALAAADDSHSCCHHDKNQSSPKAADHHQKADCTGTSTLPRLIVRYLILPSVESRKYRCKL